MTKEHLELLDDDFKTRFEVALNVMISARPTLDIETSVMEKFELRWRMKMINARINGFIQNFYNKLISADGNRTEGGATLRDNLYAVTSRK